MKHFSHDENEYFSVYVRYESATQRQLCFCILTRCREMLWLRLTNSSPENNMVGGDLKAPSREEGAESQRVGAFLSNQKKTVGAGVGDKGEREIANPAQLHEPARAGTAASPFRCFCPGKAADSEADSSNGLCKSTESAYQ